MGDLLDFRSWLVTEFVRLGLPLDRARRLVAEDQLHFMRGDLQRYGQLARFKASQVRNRSLVPALELAALE
jgi:hypothetical protein